MTQDQTRVKTVLLIEGDELASSFIESILEKAPFRVLKAADVRQALPIIQVESPDLLVLDLAARRQSGPAYCRELRNWSSAPILTISNNEEEQLVIDVLDAGADGFISLPIKPGEFLARVRALLRWRTNRAQSQDIIRTGELEIDLTQRRVFVGGNPVRLTRTEFNILALLARNHERTVSTESILETVWGPMRGDYTQSLRVHIGHIRRKIEPDALRPIYLLTHRGGSYSLSGARKQSTGKGR